jgi:uncharacterized lipoprotein YddW (UPF0748 family)
LTLCITFVVAGYGIAFAQASAPPTTLSPAPTAPLPNIPMPAPLVVTPPQATPTISSTPPLELPTLPTIPIDVTADSVGIAQQLCHAKGYQARILWVDGTANIASINTADKIKALVDQAKQSGFNTIVFDVKPIVGFTLYPSRFAQKLTEWRGNSLPVDFDPLNFMVQDAHADGLQIVANMSTFGEGHKYFNLGLGYTNPSWQTLMYEATRTVKSTTDTGAGVTIALPNTMPKDDSQLSVYTDMSQLRNPIDGAFVDVVNFDARVVAQVDGSFLGTVSVNPPDRGAILVGSGRAADYLRTSTHVGDILTYTSNPTYVPVSQVADQKITVYVNPNDPTVQQHELDIVREIVTNYPVDGMIFDDRMRYAALNADFSDITRTQFEQYVGHKINWPNDVFQISPYPNQDIIKGPEYDAWLVFRAMTIRNWLAEARAVVKSIRPQATVSVYVGSWYGEYADNGSNWAASDFDGPFPFLTNAYQQTGFAGLVDWLTTGCYYTNATMAEGGDSPGATVEGAGILSNRAVNDSSFVYAGLYAAQFPNDTDDLKRCIQAAASSTQGVMIFDLSQIIQYNLWPVFQQAFATPAVAPSSVPGLLDSVRAQHAAQKAAGITLPPYGDYTGTAGTGL